MIGMIDDTTPVGLWFGVQNPDGGDDPWWMQFAGLTKNSAGEDIVHMVLNDQGWRLLHDGAIMTLAEWAENWARTVDQFSIISPDEIKKLRIRFECELDVK